MNAATTDLVVTRTFDAAVEQVWKAWVDPEYVMRWWGPYDYTSPLAKMDVREGGTSLVCMRSPQGQDLYNTWSYQTIVPLRSIAFVMSFADADGNSVDPSTIGLPPGVPQDVRHLVTFEAAGDSTTMTVTEYGYTSDEVADLSRQGLEQTLDKMAAILATAR